MLAALALLSAASKSYEFDCEYITASTTGVIQSRQMVRGVLELKSDHEAVWNQVSVACAQGEGEYGTPADQPFMDGFTYDPSDVAATFKPELFAKFPATAVQEKNLVWDADMFFVFAAKAKNTKLGQPIKFDSAAVELAGSGTFTNKNVELTKLGSAKLNGVQCDAIKYDAFFNSIKMDMTGDIHLVGRSHYWGEFYVRSNSTVFQTGTLYEDVLGQLTMPGMPAQTINVLRKGTFAPKS